MNITADNHFLPQAYLKNWSADGTRVWMYRTLVSHARVPEWELRPARGLGLQRHLYTSVSSGAESDSFERWIADTIETPAASALKKAVSGRPLTSDDWKRLTLYVAALDQRTPTSYLEHMARWERDTPAVMQRVMKRVERELRRAGGQQRLLRAPTPDPPRHHPLPLRVHVDRRITESQSAVKAELTLGRELWLHTMHHLLTNTAHVLNEHQWGIAHPAPGLEWFTSDHPVLRLNFNSDQEYDFQGGWGSRGTEILIPLSPTHMMFTQVGKSVPDEFTFTEQQTRTLQRFLAERAHRSVFAARPIRRVAWFHPRRVDANAFAAERRAWELWHTEHSAVAGDATEGHGS